MSNGVNTLQARQFVGSLIKQKEDPEKFENLDEIIKNAGDPFAQSMLNAYRKLKTDTSVVSIASTMASNGFKLATVPMVEETLSLADKYGAVDLLSVYGQMRRNSEGFKMADRMTEVLAELKMGTISAAEAQDIIDGMEVSKPNEGAISVSDDWEKEGETEAAARRAMLAKGNQITLSKNFPGLRKLIPFLEPGTITSLVAHSGVGKSLVSSDMVDHIALNCGENVLNASTELTRYIMRCRRIAKVTGIPLKELRNGFWDARCVQAMAAYRGKGQITDFECGGVSPRTIIAEAKRRKAHIVLDYFDMADLSKSKMLGSYNTNQTDAIGFALTEFKEYAVAYDRIIWIVWQVGKEADTKQYGNKAPEEQILTLSSAMNTIKVRHRSNYGLVMNFPLVKQTENLTVPWDDKRQVTQYKGQFAAVGRITVAKDSFGDGSGQDVWVFRDGARSLVRECQLETVNLDQAAWGNDDEESN